MTDNAVSVETLRQQFEEFESATRSARADAEKVRDHRDLKQWTESEEAVLRERKQAPLVIPKIAAKVDFLMGLERQGRADPRGYPRNPEQDEGAADAASDALRFVADNTDFDQVASKVFEHACLVEGIAAAITLPVKKRKGIEIETTFAAFDEYYYDPYARDDFLRDKTFDGVVKWLDLAEAKRRYSDKADSITEALSNASSSGETHDDKPQWIDSKRQRIKVCQHYFLHEGVWHVAHFSGELFLLDAQPCPLVDEDGEPRNPIEALSGYIDRHNNRYGFAKSLLGLEQEIIHRRSSALHAIKSSQVWYEQGALTNPRKTANDLKKPDGAVEFPAGSLSENRVIPRPNTELGMAQVNLLQEAKSELESRGASSMALDGETGMSGRALRTIDTNRKLEIGPLLDNHRKWKRRVYEQMWLCVRQFWDEAKWIRVTDDEDNLKWVGLNQPVTVAEQLQEQAEQGDERAAMALQQYANDPRLQQVHTVRNAVAELDIDIIIDEAPDAVTVQQEQFETLMELAQNYGPEKVPFELMLELSSVRNKDKVIEKLQGGNQPDPMMAMQQQLQQIATELGIQAQQAEIENTQADTTKKLEDARRVASETQQNEIETAIAARFPDVRPNVNI